MIQLNIPDASALSFGLSCLSESFSVNVLSKWMNLFRLQYPSVESVVTGILLMLAMSRGMSLASNGAMPMGRTMIGSRAVMALYLPPEKSLSPMSDAKFKSFPFAMAVL